ncbi:acyltransferase [Acinetobacter lwoffii]|uniref:acyltransferase n=1 Tax=Acinetobacter lwoffii TaxID=28090 RepID=UPI001E3849ED|nr:acyltransferase [Acinetobacter lwoffii]
MSIGQDVSINSKSYINGCGGITIGDNTRIGTQSILIASNHKFGEPDLLVKDAITKQGVSLGQNIWLGARVTLLDGVTIADDSVIGACSLVLNLCLNQGYMSVFRPKKSNPYKVLCIS